MKTNRDDGFKYITVADDKRGYIDMVSLDCLHKEKGFMFFNQEFYIENFPANAVFIRTIGFVYRDSPDLEKLYPREEVLKYF